MNHIVDCIPVELSRRFAGQHCNWWTAEKLIGMLHDVEFETGYLSAHGQSASPAVRNINLFDNTHPPLSLYVEAAA
jgi:hypothetical protein